MATTKEASIHPKWVRDMLFKGALFILFAGYFFFDGLYWWPIVSERAQAYTAYVDEGGSKHEWPEYAKEKFGWDNVKKEYSKTHIRDSNDYLLQIILGSAIGLFGLYFPVKVVLDRKLTLRSDGEKVYPPRGEPVPFDWIVRVDTKKWEKQGLAYVRYVKGGKKESSDDPEEKELSKLTLDDLKFDGGELILEDIQSYLGEELQSTKRARLKQERAEAIAKAREGNLAEKNKPSESNEGEKQESGSGSSS